MAKRKTTKVVRGILSDRPQRVNKEVWYYEEPAGLVIVDYKLHKRLLENPRSATAFAILPWRKLIASVERYKKATKKRSTRPKP